MSEVIDKPKSARVLVEQRIGLAEQMRNDWAVNAEEGTTIEEVLDPQYWAHLAVRFTQFDRIEVRAESGEWMADLLVVGTGRNWAQVHLLHHYELVPRVETMPAATKHRIEWKGPQRKHVVIRLSDNAAVHEGLATKAEAATWLAQYESKIG